MGIGGNNSIGGVIEMKNEKQTAKRFRTFAICCCLCLLAVGAGVTYRGLTKAPAEQAAEVDQPVTAVQTPALDTAIFDQNKQSNDGGEAPDGEEKQPAEKKEQKAEPKAAEPKTKENTKPDNTENTQKTEKTAEPVFSYPVEGKVVLPYSADHAIYDPTLDQYRTNTSISLAAAEGTEVKAAADGTVKDILEDTESGNVVVIEHSNGWLTTYGQLAVSVKEGDRVKQGQAIGQVDTPTKYGAALGSHLEFAMEKEGRSVDPSKTVEQE